METAKNMTLTLESSLPLRLAAWASERFPAIHVLTGLILYAMTAVVARATGTSDPIGLHAGDLLGAIALTGHFLLLRVLDEHKDFEVDSMNHPERVLQRGLISLADLRKVGTAAAAFGIGYSISVDRGLGTATAAWVAMAGWTYLMAMEFFCRDWIRARLLLYALSHMLITPLAVLWAVRLAAPEATLGTEVMFLLSLTFLSGLAFELARKSRGPEEEGESLDSYSKILGHETCGVLLIGLLGLVLANQLSLLARVSSGPPWMASVLSLATFALSVSSIARYIRSPSLKGRKANEATSGLFMLVNYLSAILIPLSQQGGRWI